MKRRGCYNYSSFFLVPKKKGISTIVATVLIVLITVASVAILWTALLPLIQQVTFVEDPNVQIKVDRSEYTAYDEANKLLSVRVTRGSDDADIMGLKFVVDDAGNTHEHKVYDVLTKNSGKVYYFSTNDFSTVSSISVIPIFKVAGSEKEGSTVNTFEKLPKQNLVAKAQTNDVIAYGYPVTNIPGLVAYYPFTSDASDYSGRGNHGTPSIISLVQDNYLSLEVGNNYVDLPSDLGYVSQVSAFGWVRLKSTALGNYHILMGPSQLEISIHESSQFMRAGIHNSTNNRVTSDKGSGIVDYNWHFIGFTFDGSNMKQYIDGKYVGERTINGLISIVPNRRIGSFGTSTSYYLNGSIDDVMIFNRALTPEEVKQIYEAGRS